MISGAAAAELVARLDHATVEVTGPDGDRWLVIPTILITVNVIPFAVYLVLLARLIETTGKTDFGRLLAFTTACFGTFLLTFSGTLSFRPVEAGTGASALSSRSAVMVRRRRARAARAQR